MRYLSIPIQGMGISFPTPKAKRTFVSSTVMGAMIAVIGDAIGEFSYLYLNWLPKQAKYFFLTSHVVHVYIFFVFFPNIFSTIISVPNKLPFLYMCTQINKITAIST